MLDKLESHRLVYNAIRTPDGTVLESRHRHDYQVHVDKNGKEYMVDGGLDYTRRTVHADAPYEELSVYTDAPHDIQRQVIKWGTYGKQGDEPYQLKKLADMTDSHIKAVLAECRPYPSWADAMELELSLREQGKYPSHTEDKGE